MAKTNTWQPNETQKDFLKVLEGLDAPKSLKEINEIAGKEFKTGSINTLISKGLVEHGDEVEIEVVVKRKVKSYKLATKGE